MTNIERSRAVLQSLFEQGVREFCVCAGSRNSPLVAVLEKARQVRRYSCFEERSAAFFALGRIKLDKRPVAVVTTSGTAAAELLAATIEAYYAALPLVLITADRPPEYRGSGSPQTIEQVGLYSHYATTQDLVLSSQTHVQLTPRGPTHINICFDEPLLDQPVEEFDFQSTLAPRAAAQAKPERLTLPPMKRPLVILGRLSSHNQKAVETALESLELPVMAEGPSGLRESPKLRTLKSGDGIFKTKLARIFDGVIRIGSVPTLRYWRDLEKLAIPVVNISEEPFLGLTRGQMRCSADLDLSCLHELSVEPGFADALLVLDATQAARLQQILKEEPHSEAGWFQALSCLIPSGSHVYLGNSLPVREWDLAATFEHKTFRLEVSRGANGIDGQISTFLGASSAQQENWGLFGDLTTLYDLVAPWMDAQLEPQRSRIVVINNFGGQIFSRLFQSPSFLNSHDMQFEPWARLWKRDYQCWRHLEQLAAPLGERAVLEVQPDAASSQRFWRKYGELWADL